MSERSEKGWLKEYYRGLQQDITDVVLEPLPQKTKSNQNTASESTYHHYLHMFQQQKEIKLSKCYYLKTGVDLIKIWGTLSAKCKDLIISFLDTKSLYILYKSCRYFKENLDMPDQFYSRINQDFKFKPSTKLLYRNPEFPRKYYQSFYYYPQEVFNTNHFLTASDQLSDLAINLVDIQEVKNTKLLSRLHTFSTSFGINSHILKLSYFEDNESFTLWIGGYNNQKQKATGLIISNCTLDLKEDEYLENIKFISDCYILAYCYQENEEDKARNEHFYLYNTEELAHSLAGLEGFNSDFITKFEITFSQQGNSPFGNLTIDSNHAKIDTIAFPNLIERIKIEEKVYFIYESGNSYLVLVADLKEKSVSKETFSFSINENIKGIYVPQSKDKDILFYILSESLKTWIVKNDGILHEQSSLQNELKDLDLALIKPISHRFGSYKLGDGKIVDYCIIQLGLNFYQVELKEDKTQLLPKFTNEKYADNISGWACNEEILVVVYVSICHVYNLRKKDTSYRSRHTLVPSMDPSSLELHTLKSVVPAIYWITHTYLYSIHFAYQEFPFFDLRCWVLPITVHSKVLLYSHSLLTLCRKLTVRCGDYFEGKVQDFYTYYEKVGSPEKFIKVFDHVMLFNFGNLNLYFDFEKFKKVPKIESNPNKLLNQKFDLKILQLTLEKIERNEGSDCKKKDAIIYGPYWKKIPENKNRNKLTEKIEENKGDSDQELPIEEREEKKLDLGEQRRQYLVRSFVPQRKEILKIINDKKAKKERTIKAHKGKKGLID